MKHCTFLLPLAAILIGGPLRAQTPPLINYQGRIVVNNVNFDSAPGIPGLFRFMLVSGDGSQVFWRNAADANADGKPDVAVVLPVAKGLYSVLLGDSSVANMLPIPDGVFANPDVRLRVFFDDGVNGVQQLSPDQRLAPTAYLASNSVGSSTLANGAVTSGKLATGAAVANITPGSIGGALLGNSTIGGQQLAAGAVGTAQLADGSVTAAKVLRVADWGRFPSSTIISTPTVGSNVVPVGTGKLLISDPRKSGQGSNVDLGAAYLVDLSGALLRTFENPFPEAYDRFGTAVAAVGTDRLLITAPSPGSPTSRRGEAYLFDLQGNLLLTMRRPNSNPTQSDNFGYVAVAVGSDKMLIAERYADAVHLFDLAGNLLRTFNPPAGNMSFGSTLAAVGTDKVLIGAQGYSNGIGRAYLYNLAGILLATFDNPTPAGLESFGAAMATVGSDKVLISTGTSIGTGGAYLFNLTGTLLQTFPPATFVSSVENDKVLLGTKLYDLSGTLLKTFTDTGFVSSSFVVPDKIAFAGSSGVHLFTSSSYAPGIVADGARGGSITTDSIAAGAVQTDNIAAGAVRGSNIAAGTIDHTRLGSAGATAIGQVLSWTGLNVGWVNQAFSVLGTVAYYNGGNVGIGTNAPNHRLRIAGGPSWTSNGWTGAIELENAAAIGWRANAAGQRFGIGHSGGGLYVFRTPNDPGTIGNPAAYDLLIDDSGMVGMGTINPGSKLDVNGDVSATRLILRADPFAPQNAAVLCGNAAVTTFVPYNTANNHALSILVHDADVRTLRIRGGADLAEPFAMSQHGVPRGAVVSIDPKHPGKLKMSGKAYDKKVAGIVSGANGINPGISMVDEQQLEAGENVALSGRVYVKANTSAGEIGPGDLLTTSDVPGEAMKAANHRRAQGSILGKAMTTVDETTGMVLVLVTLQ